MLWLGSAPLASLSFLKPIYAFEDSFETQSCSPYTFEISNYRQGYFLQVFEWENSWSGGHFNHSSDSATIEQWYQIYGNYSCIHEQEIIIRIYIIRESDNKVKIGRRWGEKIALWAVSTVEHKADLNLTDV